MDYLVLGCSPNEEDCVQVSATKNYLEAMKREVDCYKEMLQKRFEKILLPEMFLSRKAESHDFGTYYEVVVRFNEQDEKQCTVAYFMEGHCPNRWDEDKVFELTDLPQLYEEKSNEEETSQAEQERPEGY